MRSAWIAALALSLAFPALAADRAHIAAPTRAQAHGKVVGYFPQWGVYDNYFVGNLVHSGAAERLTQINYAQGFIRDSQCVVADPQADMNLAYTVANSVDGVADDPAAILKGNFHQLQKLRRSYPHLRILLSLEGRATDFAAAAQPEVREGFVRSCIQRFVLGHLAPGIEAPGLFDGFDVDWEYPNAAQNENFIALLAEFHKQMDAARPGLTLSIAAGATRDHIEAVDWRRVAAEVDEIGVMTYDYNGPWSHTTGLVAPLRSSNPNADTASKAIADFTSHGAPVEKLLLGIPFYAYQWTEVSGENNGLGIAGRPVRGNLNQSTAKILAASPDAKLFRDPISQAPWIYDGKNFLTFEDATSLHAKATYVREQHLGGVMIWELSGDADDAPLLRVFAGK